MLGSKYEFEYENISIPNELFAMLISFNLHHNDIQ